eukprot:CAMPEP_0196588362 /NCGR_PEP_ID=MMETSP1081-20130531/60351_1 /TAXON_ID=36882 /ORGANISM="Pyramimonas amylifera, Strain CCMP720" /LENGTH=95 /DNA_ID=CAMNT_0041910835 /DNA_START=236 /DNA_END=523 /DNA_ORIENTATION=-
MATPPPATVSSAVNPTSSTSDFVVSYEELKNDLSFQILTADEAIAKWNDLGVDGTRRERFLSDAEFNTIFQMSKEDFEKLGEWKRIHLRKQYHLF